jgi:hypothetical protein
MPSNIWRESECNAVQRVGCLRSYFRNSPDVLRSSRIYATVHGHAYCRPYYVFVLNEDHPG